MLGFPSLFSVLVRCLASLAAFSTLRTSFANPYITSLSSSSSFFIILLALRYFYGAELRRL